MNQQRLVLVLAAAVVVIAALAAVAIGGGGSPTPSVAPSATATVAPPPSASPSEVASPTPSDVSTVPPSPSGSSLPIGSEPTIDGAALPTFDRTVADPAIGMPAPVATGPSFDGTAVTIGAPGRPQVILFLAHWCPHCQREVPLLQDWIDANGMPADVDLRSVATSINADAPNYPPDAWLAGEGWTVPVLVDPTNTVADAYGLPGFPYWVFLDADGKVAVRTTGELTIEQLEQVIALLAAS